MENQTKKEVVFSAIQPSGTITLGNYLGAVRNWVTMQNEYDCIYALADLHTITVRQTPAVMRKNIIDAYASIMACGIDVEKSLFFIQTKPFSSCIVPVSSQSINRYNASVTIRSPNARCL